MPFPPPWATAERKQHVFLWLAGLFVAALIVADLIGGRFFRVGTVDLSVGMLAFPLTFVLAIFMARHLPFFRLDHSRERPSSTQPRLLRSR